MKDLEREFEEMVRKNRGTIYTVCYMFSNDQDEVADLFRQPPSAERGDERPRVVDQTNGYLG